MLDFDILSIILFFSIYLVIFMYLRYFKHIDVIELYIMSLFYIYLVLVIKYTQYPIIFDSLYVEAFQGHSVDFNLIPLLFLTKDDLMTSILNIILFIPFGFLYFIISKFNYKKTILLGFSVSFFIEIIQLIISIITKVYFRIADINDIIFNTIGVILGISCYFIFFITVKKLIKLLSIEPNNFFRRILKEC